MKMRSMLGLSTVALALAVSGCTAFDDSPTGDGEPQVATAFYPLQYVADRVAGGHAEVDLLTPPGKESHDLEPTVEETARIAQASLVVYEHGFQPAIDDAIEQNATGETLDAAEIVGLEPFTGEHADEHGHEHGHDHDDEHDEHSHEGESEDAHHEGDGHDHGGELDPHFWLDPIRMATLGDAVADALAEIDPDHADDYAANADDLRTDLEALDVDYADGLSSCERHIIVVSHDAFGYLGKYGIEVAPVAGLTPDAEPNPVALGDLQQLIRDEGLTTVFNERLASPRLTEALARDTGLKTAVLDPIEGLSDETADEDYLSLMQANLSALREANGCQ
ncbi:metal ABC transporter substrate-binding protein [Nocardioides sp. GXZ039]|uniref:metal ABC transporter substrate-binding protein n=1 Tax=Nocardioides sp. GXZ039 TaxID=3136018 RepID=UPI0030F437AD